MFFPNYTIPIHAYTLYICNMQRNDIENAVEFLSFN